MGAVATSNARDGVAVTRPAGLVGGALHVDDPVRALRLGRRLLAGGTSR